MAENMEKLCPKILVIKNKNGLHEEAVLPVSRRFGWLRGQDLNL
jgi:hypothetical protein